MADRAQVSKVAAYAATGQEDAVKVTKVVAYFLLGPGSSEEDTSNRQGHVYSQITRRLRS